MYEEKTIEELELRKGEISKECEVEGADLTTLMEEVKSINEEIENRKKAEAARVEIRKAVAEGEGEIIETRSEEKKTMTVEEIRKSHEYNVAYAEYIKTGKDEECRALLTELVSGTVPVPEYVEGRVRTNWEKLGLMSLVRKTYAKGILKVGFEKSATAATNHTEGTATVSEEDLVLGIVTLTPVSIKKWIRISDEALDLSGEAFLDYIYDELTYQIAKKAQGNLIAAITALTASATSTAVGVGIVAGTPSVGVVATAIGSLSDEAANPVIVMNKGTWAQFKSAQYDAKYAVDPFEGLPVYFDNTLPAYTAAGTTGAAWAIVGDFGRGAQANFPNGDEITIKVDDKTDMASDLVRILGREYVGIGIVGDKHFAKITF